MNKLLALMLASIVSLVISGCASSVYQGKYAWDDGWRQGKVTAVGTGVPFAEKVGGNCTKEGAFLPQQRYATIRYTMGSRGSWRKVPIASNEISRTVPIASDSHWKVNDLLYINISDCKADLQARE